MAERVYRLVKGDTITAQRRPFTGNPPTFPDNHPTKSTWRWLPEVTEQPDLAPRVDSIGDPIEAIEDGEVVVRRQVNRMSLADAQSMARRLAHEAAAAALQAIMDRYPPHERETWTIQLAQARAFQDNPAAETGMMDILAQKRGQTRAEVATRIITKAAQFEALAAEAVGTQQAREDQVEAAVDVDGVIAILQAEQLL